jgi:AraC-like DNA-binding protein
VEAAKNMLLYSEYSLDEIANYLAFASTSYFISTFKKSAGMTPREYRNVKKISF